MTVYVELEQEEQTALKKEILEALASAVKMQDTSEKIARLEKNKKTVMIGVATAMKRIAEEITKIKEALPEAEEKAKQAKPSKKEIGYKQELEAIKEKIAKLS